MHLVGYLKMYLIKFESTEIKTLRIILDSKQKYLRKRIGRNEPRTIETRRFLTALYRLLVIDIYRSDLPAETTAQGQSRSRESDTLLLPRSLCTYEYFITSISQLVWSLC